MEKTEKQVSKPVQSWTRRAEKEQPPEIDYYSELNTWLQYAITEAEKTKNSTKKEQLLTLQKDL